MENKKNIVRFGDKEVELKFTFGSMLDMMGADIDPRDFQAPSEKRKTTRDDFLNAWAYLFGVKLDVSNAEEVEAFCAKIQIHETPISLHYKAQRAWYEYCITLPDVEKKTKVSLKTKKKK